MRKVDLRYQVLFFGLAAMCLLGGILLHEGFFGLIPVFQFCIGLQQLASAFITSDRKKYYSSFHTKGTRIFWAAVLVYFLVLTIFIAFCEIRIIVTWFYTAWFIAVYYYIFTLKLVYGQDCIHNFFRKNVNKSTQL